MKRIAIVLFVILPLLVAAKQRPNIILIMTDDQGWFDAGFNGNLSIKTPNLDKLAGEGLVFNRFYSASAVCSPTRASVITGRNPYRMGIPTANSGNMREQEITIAELLKKEGYATGHFGKWHLGTLTKKQLDANRGGVEKFFAHFTIPSMHGYDEFFATESKVPTYDPMIFPAEFKEGESKKFGWTAIKDDEKSEPYGTAYWVGNEQQCNDDLSGDDTRLIMDRAIPFIQKSIKADRPFFTTIWTHTPHLPVVASEKYKKMYNGMTNQQQIYYGCISALDDQIGRLWDELEELGVADNTMIWYCSDNGPERNTPGSAGLFRERKRSLHEGGLRTPAFVVWKNELKGGGRSDYPAFTSDYLPTLVRLLELDYPDDRPLDGQNIWPYLSESDAVRKKAMGFRYGKSISWVNHQYKLISKDEGATFELYDLLNDQQEERNILKKNKALAGQMQKELKIWMESVNRSHRGDDYQGMIKF